MLEFVAGEVVDCAVLADEDLAVFDEFDDGWGFVGVVRMVYRCCDELGAFCCACVSGAAFTLA